MQKPLSTTTVKGALSKQPLNAWPVAIGCVAGLLATVPMTLVMQHLHRRLPEHQRYPLPPRIITDGIAMKVSIASGGAAPALAAHYAFGAATGALYAAIAARTDRGPGAVSGIAFGLGVWAASYLGWVPAAGLIRRRRSNRESATR